MNPKEKADELVNKFIGHTKEWSEIDGYVIDKYRAKQCALIAVDEVIEALDFHQWQNRNEIDWWKEVKIEIEQL